MSIVDMSTVESKDGTRIAYSRTGDGPPVIVVDGALCYRKFGPSTRLAALLAGHFTVVTYDRRGRGSSGDTPPYSIDREIEDLQALIGQAGGSASLYGVSSGAALALETAARGRGVKKLVLYEAPFTEDQSRAAAAGEYSAQLRQLLAADRRGDAAGLFLRRAGLPGALITLMRVLPMWSKLTAIAPTLAYDDAVLSIAKPGQPLPAGRWTTVTIPALCLAGGNSPAWLHDAMRALAQALPNAQFRALEGQTHVVKPKVHAPLLEEFFTSDNHGQDVSPATV
jgi:pimeloyl-ACP methyl ester carboxylesterase